MQIELIVNMSVAQSALEFQNRRRHRVTSLVVLLAFVSLKIDEDMLQKDFVLLDSNFPKIHKRSVLFGLKIIFRIILTYNHYK